MPQSFRRKQSALSISPVVNSSKKTMRQRAKQFDLSWQHLQDLCPDPDSQHRLRWLQQQYGKRERGASESAQAEVDMAMLLVRAGLSLSFVKEMEHRTADLECYLDHDRLFVEVTVIVPIEPDRSREFLTNRGPGNREDEDESGFYKDALVKRILARISEKANQLADYCAPVLLAVTIVPQEQNLGTKGKHNGRRMALDLQQMGGVITQALASAPPVSAVLLTLWNIQPAESRANIRLSNVHLGEWISGNKGSSEIRLLAQNPAASHSIEPEVQLALRRVL
ncbi:MAG: hypothetical protein VST68_02150 [Nitrospirota bacterium]|nr:hypothetical protein [Nitrospirota bacterium]